MRRKQKGLQDAIQLLRDAAEHINMWFENDSNLDELDSARGEIASAIEQLEELRRAEVL